MNNDPESVEGALGEILHAAEDFYSHTNWVESGLTGIVESGLAAKRNNRVGPGRQYANGRTTGRWVELKPFCFSKRLRQSRCRRLWADRAGCDTYAVTVDEGGTSYAGIISGNVRTDPTLSKTPDGLTVPHGGLASFSVSHNDGLAKDDWTNPKFGDAIILAIDRHGTSSIASSNSW